jgi:AraC-like DNA-binding protein
MVSQPTFAEIRQAVRHGVAQGRMSVDAIARRLHCSTSTLHRRLRRHNTTFSEQRTEARLELAFHLLTSGYGAAFAASKVGVTRDYLGVMMRRSYGLSPREIQWAVRLAEGLRQQPRTRQELASFRRNDEQLATLLDQVDARHPLAAWAKELVVLGHRPEYDEREFMRELREEEARRRLEAQHEADAAAVASLDETECRTTAPDFGYLRAEAEHNRERLRWRRRQLRKARSGVAAPASRSARGR